MPSEYPNKKTNALSKTTDKNTDKNTNKRSGKRTIDPAALVASLRRAPFHLEMRKGARGAVILVCGVVGVSDFTAESLTVLTHGGRLTVRGSGLCLTSLENRTLEIVGRIEEVVVGYGKA